VSDVGRGGDVAVSVQQASLSGGATITTKTISSQAGSSITVQGLQGTGSMADSVVLSGSGTGIISESVGGTTRAGDITVQAKTVSLRDGAVIQAATAFTTAAGGNVTIEADSIDLSNGGRISSQASDSDAGQINITTNTFTLNNSSIATNTQGQGRAGDIVLDAGSVGFSNGALINSSSTGTGNAGNITINSKSSVILQDSSITTTSDLSSGGQVTITAPQMVQLTNSKITTSVAGSDADTAGGNISIDPQFVVLNSSQILATAFAGTGGNISIVSNVFLSSADSVVDATSQLGISGTVNIQSPVQNISGELTPMPQEFSSAAALLAQQCAARVADGKFSTFVVTGREGLPVEPGGFLGSPRLTPETFGFAFSLRDSHRPIAALTGAFHQYEARPIQLAKFGETCH
jgi:large exoprotein involved in heme utilization and adhesion